MREALSDVTFDSPSADALAADPAFWRIYDSSFPANEREPQSVILESLRLGTGPVVRARHGETTAGLVIAHLLREPPVIFVVYLAVDPEFRSHGIGPALFEKIWSVGNQRSSELGREAAGMVWEVDIPERAASEKELQRRRGRIAFFGRLGGHLLPVPYYQPPVDGIDPVPMHLMFRPAPGGTLPDSAGCAALIRAIYFEKYHRANGIPRALLQDLLRRTAD